MSRITQTNCDYITANKTVETILISEGIREKTIFIYNYKCQSYRVFSTKEQLDSFWLGVADEEQHFDNEEELDEWLCRDFLN